MTRTTQLNQIQEWLVTFSNNAEIDASDNDLHRDREAEDLYCQILSIILDCSLVNLNYEHKNHPAIDLGDEEKGIAVQVTGETGADSIRRKLDKFFEYGLDQRYPNRLLFMVNRPKKNFDVKFTANPGYPFDQKKDIWDVKRLCQHIKKLPDDKIEQIHRYLSKQLGYDQDQKLIQHAESSAATLKDILNHFIKSTRAVVILLALLIVVAGCCLLLSECSDANQETEPSTAPPVMYETVAETLTNATLTKTNAPISDYDEKLNQHDSISSLKDRSLSFPFAGLCADLKANPISAFYRLDFQEVSESQDFVELAAEDTDFLENYASRFKRNHGKRSPRYDNAELMLEDIFSLSERLDDGFDLDEKFLARMENSAGAVVHDDPADQCYYAYYVYYGDYTAHILCVYLFPDEQREELTSVEFQLLNLQYCAGKPLGSAEGLQQIAQRNSAQTASLITAIEYLLCGETIFDYETYRQDGFRIPTEYTLRNYQASLTQTQYESTALGLDKNGGCIEQAQLIRYRIEK